MVSQRISRAPAVAFLVAVLVVATSLAIVSGCTSCRDDIVDAQIVDGYEVAVHHRVCGGSAAYTISIAPPGKNIEGYADRYEPFLVHCDCYKFGVADPPLVVRFLANHVISVEYDSSLEVVKQRATQFPFTMQYRERIPARVLPPN